MLRLFQMLPLNMIPQGTGVGETRITVHARMLRLAVYSKQMTNHVALVRELLSTKVTDQHLGWIYSWLC